MNRDYDNPWTCLECGWENPEDDFCCTNCRELKPVQCECCLEDFVPWSETGKKNSKIIRDLCNDCYYKEPETEQDRIDALEDDLYHQMKEDGEL
jgi:hypothetical protein